MTNIAHPEVTLLAYTQLNEEVVGYLDNGGYSILDMDLDQDSEEPEDLIEFAGRACYQSFHKPNPKTAKNADYIKRTVIEQNHGSIAEHASASFYLTGVSRAFLAEITRHRHLSFSVQSQRFVNEEDSKVVVPPAVRREGGSYHLETVAEELKSDYAHIVNYLSNAGLPRKQAREAARAVLPNATETRMVITGNMRAWRDVMWKRLDPAADAEIREVCNLILDELIEIAPSLFSDIHEWRMGSE